MVGTASSFIQYNTVSVHKIDNANPMICSLCHKPSKRLASHHIIPRFLSISSDEELMEVCVSCHRRLDEMWRTFILWGSFKPVNWTNPMKDIIRRKNYVKINRERIRGYVRTQADKRRAKRRELGIQPRALNIKRRYDDLSIFKKQLSYLYWDKNLSWRDVAKEMKLSASCVMKWVKLLGITSRPIPIAVHLACQRRGKLW